MLGLIFAALIIWGLWRGEFFQEYGLKIYKALPYKYTFGPPPPLGIQGETNGNTINCQLLSKGTTQAQEHKEKQRKTKTKDKQRN